MSKIFAITSSGKSEKSFLDLRFGKCDNVVIYNKETRNYTILENPYKNNDNSGIKLVDLIKNEDVSVVITGEVGPKVSQALEKEKLQLVLLHEEKIKIEDIFDRINR
jgi:predicted Fe-Mo cluster-binding NifX family protein